MRPLWRALWLALAASCGLHAAAKLPAQLRIQALAPGTVAVVQIPATDLPPRCTLTGLSQEAGFYLWGSATAVALLAVPLETKPGNLDLRLSWEGGLKSQGLRLKVLPSPYPRQKIKVARLHKRLKAARQDGEAEVLEGAQARSPGGPRWRGAFIAPVPGPLTAPFGALRTYNRGQASWRHKGEDLRAGEGTPVLASNEGQVALARPSLALSGGTVVLAHGYGLTSAYYHLSRLEVAEGQLLKKGQVLGLSGATGLATGPHLHFQMELNGHPVDPRQWILEQGPSQASGRSLE